MKSFLDRFRRKDEDEEGAPSEAVQNGEASARADRGEGAEAAMNTANDDTLTLELGDFLHRIPNSLLKDGPHDLRLPLRFDLDAVADRVARGETTVPLWEIQLQVPHVFREDASIEREQEVRFPWQKVLTLLDESEPALTPGLTNETLAQKLQKRRVERNIDSREGTNASTGANPGASATPIIRGTGSRQVSWFSRTAPASSGGADSDSPRLSGVKQPAPPPSPVQTAPPPVLRFQEPAAQPLGAPEDGNNKISNNDAELARARDTTRSQPARARGESEHQLKAVTPEKASLQDQADSPSVANESAPDPGPGNPQRSQKEYQRHIDELNRRILALEGAQKDRTQEAVKEKEIRLRTERQLAAAERSLEESASQMEALREEARREMENALRQRDAEADRLRQEQARDAERVQEEGDRLASERDDLQARLREAEALASSSQGQSWENRATAQLEEEIESYRTRIKTLLQERDAAIKEREVIAAELTGRPPGAKAEGEPDAVAREEEGSRRLQEDLAALTQTNETLAREKSEIARQLEELKNAETAGQGVSDNVQAEYSTVAARLRQDHDRAIQERDQAQLATEKLMAEMSSLRDQHRQDRERFDRERNASQQSTERGTAGLRKTIDTQQKALAALTKERDDLQNGRENSLAELNQARAESRRLSADVLKVRDELLAEHEKLAGELNETRTSLEGSLAALEKERDELRTAQEVSTGELARLERERKEFSEKFVQLRKDWHEEREALSTQITAAYQTRDEHRSQNDETAAELAAMQSQAEKAARDLETLQREWLDERAHLHAQLTTLTKEHSALAGEADAAAKRTTEMEGQLSTLDRQLQQLNEEKEALAAEKKREAQEHALQKETMELSHQQALEGALSTSEAALAEKNKTIGNLQEQADQLAAEREQLTAAHQSELAALRTEQQKVAEALEQNYRQTHASASEREKAISALQEQLSHLTSEHQSLAAEHQQFTEGKRHELESLRIEHQIHLAERDDALAELEASQAAMQREHEKKLSETEAALGDALDALRLEQQAALASVEARQEAALAAAYEATEQKEKEIAEIQRKLQEKDAAQTKEIEEMAKQNKAALTRKEKELATEKQASVAQLAEEKAKLLEERDAIDRTHSGESRTVQAQLTTEQARVRELQQQLAQIEAERAAERSSAAGEKEELLPAVTVEKQVQLTQKHTEGSQREKAIADLASERDTAVAEMQAATEAFIKDREFLKAEGAAKIKELAVQHQAELADTERLLSDQIGELTRERDAARAEILVLNQRLATDAAAAQKAQAELSAERDLVVKERETLAAALKEAKESHELESASLSKEFRAVIRQRDETAERLEGERAAHQQQMEQLQGQLSALTAEEIETRNRLEQENGRLRRDRDSIGRERDELRERIEKAFEQQREFLSGMAGVAVAPMLRESPRNYQIPAPEPVAVNPTVYVMPKIKSKEPVHFVEAELVEEKPPQPAPVASGSVHLPRIRPLPVRPPQVRKLG